ncbi:MAG: hypothetical protein AAF609_01675 [Cyanobacteria bacterium P01_C01_bin.120]
MAIPADFSFRWGDVLAQRDRLKGFKAHLSPAVKTWLQDCEWTLIAGAGQSQVPLFVLRTPERVRLRHPLLLQLAESVHTNWGPIDFSLFSAESRDPIRVLSQTLVDLNRHQQ